jgi:hypothetical protein
MAAFALIALFAGGPLGMCLALAYGVVAVTKINKVDAEFAKRGETTPGTRLIEKWLDGRKARGRAPADAKPAKYGMWRYAWQRWQALWETLADEQKIRDEALRKQRAEAAANGWTPPKAPGIREQAAADWKWIVDTFVTPRGGKPAPAAGESVPRAPVDEGVSPEAASPAPHDGPRIACELCGQTLSSRGDGWEHPSSSGCPNRPDAAGVPDPEPSVAVCVCGSRDRVRNGLCPRCDERDYASRQRRREGSEDAGSTSRDGQPTEEPTEGDDMTTSTKQSGEVTGIPSAIHYLNVMAAAHAEHAGNEALVARLADMKVGPGDLSKVQAAMAASRNAATLFTDAATSIDKNNAGVRDAFASAPDAADKQHQVAE